jgi:aminoglycoside 3-N-acetyltransferase
MPVTPPLSRLLAGGRARLAPAYRRVRREWARLHRALDRRTLSAGELARLLDGLGVTPGATVLLHTSMEHIGRRVPGLTPVALIRLVQGLLGERGMLLMPTYPFRGRQSAYADRHDRFDVGRTPSQAGLVTEVFRRMPGVVRSLHPTHPIAGWGRGAAELLAAHHLGTAFGPGSPMYRLGERGGVVVGLGTRPQDAFTILHVPEELHPAARAWAYEESARLMTIVDGARRIPYRVHVLRPDPGRDRLERDILAALLREGVVTTRTAAGLPCCAGRAARVIERALELIEASRHRFARPPGGPADGALAATAAPSRRGRRAGPPGSGRGRA